MKIKAFLIALTFAFTLSGINAFAASGIHGDPNDNAKTVKERIAKMTPVQKEIRITEIKERIAEIKAMDKSQLTKAERKDLRRELKDMKKEVKEMNPTYIYISGAGLVIIILLLIILL
ncbi:MAG TPA: hypothetical protein VKR32_01640 [Puia sp.]|nr:hypothetical protein [Puia sp.]